MPQNETKLAGLQNSQGSAGSKTRRSQNPILAGTESSILAGTRIQTRMDFQNQYSHTKFLYQTRMKFGLETRRSKSYFETRMKFETRMTHFLETRMICG